MGERLFVAVELPAAARRALAEGATALRPRLPPARWVRSEAMHLTLAFLGDVDVARVPELERELAAVCAGHPCRRLRLAGVDGFPPRGKVRVLWVGVEVGAGVDVGAGLEDHDEVESAGDGLAALREDVAGAVRRVLPGVLDDRRFHPHVTLARCRPPWPRRALDVAAALEPPEDSFPLDAVTLFASELRPTGAVHRVVSRHPLAVAEAESRPTGARSRAARPIAGHGRPPAAPAAARPAGDES